MTTTVRERPMLMYAHEVREILEGRMSQFRRPINLKQFGRSDTPGYDWTFRDRRMLWQDYRNDDFLKLCPFGHPGDRLWVKEAFCHRMTDDGYFAYNAEGNLDPSCCYYAADGVSVQAVDGDGFQKYRKDGREASPWAPSIRMPRWASRITLEVSGVRVERVQDISNADALKEGVFRVSKGMGWHWLKDWDCHYQEPRWAFKALWDSLNSKRGCGWDANPWFWVVEFKRIW